MLFIFPYHDAAIDLYIHKTKVTIIPLNSFILKKNQFIKSRDPHIGSDMISENIQIFANAMQYSDVSRLIYKKDEPEFAV